MPVKSVSLLVVSNSLTLSVLVGVLGVLFEPVETVVTLSPVVPMPSSPMVKLNIVSPGAPVGVGDGVIVPVGVILLVQLPPAAVQPPESVPQA